MSELFWVLLCPVCHGRRLLFGRCRHCEGRGRIISAVPEWGLDPNDTIRGEVYRSREAAEAALSRS